jgi:hypothetical protein
MSQRKRNNRRRKRPVIFRNRRDPKSRWIPFWDMVLNAYEWIYGFWYRVPKGSALKWRGNKITGHVTRHY